MRGALGKAGFVLLVLVAGCAEAPTPSPPATAPATAPLYEGWSYVSSEDLGDWSMQLVVAAEGPTECSASLDAQGKKTRDGPNFLVGFVADGAAEVAEASRAIEPQAGAGPASSTPASQDAVLSYAPTVPFHSNVEFGPGEATVFWAAQGVADTGRLEGRSFVADLECDGAFEIVGRGTTDTAFLWNDQSMRSDGFVSPGIGGYGGGRATVDGDGPFVVAFSKLYSDQQSLTIESPGWTESWDLSGTDRVDVGRAGVGGPVSLAFQTMGTLDPTTVRGPWTSGMVATYTAVDAFPSGEETLEPWTPEDDEPVRT